MFFSGFVNYDQKLLINTDGSGNITIHYWTNLSNILTGKATGKFEFEEQKARDKFTSSNTKIEKIKFEDKQGDSTRHVYIDLTFNDIGKLAEAKGFGNINISWKETSDGMELRYILLKDVTIASDTNAKNYKLNYEIEIPGEIVSTNGKRDGQKVVWEYTAAELVKDLPMIVVSKKSKEKTCGIFGLVAAVLIIGLFYFTQRNKKRLIEK